MQAKDIIGKTITDIYARQEFQQETPGNDIYFLEIDKSFFVRIPFSEKDEISIENINNNAISIFSKEYSENTLRNENVKKTNKEKVHREDRRAFFRQMGKHFGTMIGRDNLTEESNNKTDKTENKALKIKDRKIIDFIWDEVEGRKGLFLLDNGGLITEINGTEQDTLNYYEDLGKVINTGIYDYAELERITYDIP